MTSVSAATGIVAQDVCKSFGDHLVLDQVNLISKEFGLHPLGAWCDNTSEPLAGMLRPRLGRVQYRRRPPAGAGRGNRRAAAVDDVEARAS